jgi:hypothetical protein
MNESTKRILIAIGLGFILVYLYKRNQSLEAEKDVLTQKLNEIPEIGPGSETAKKNEEFAEVNDYCDLLSYFKASINLYRGYDLYDHESLYDQEFLIQAEILLCCTTHFFNENKGIRKSFLYDINKTTANAMGVDIYPREFNYQYTAGVISLGDKGADVKQLQELINSIYAKIEFTEKVDVNGTYDKITLGLVQKTFAGTSALIDETKGTISKEFVNNFTSIFNNLKNN